MLSCKTAKVLFTVMRLHIPQLPCYYVEVLRFIDFKPKNQVYCQEIMAAHVLGISVLVSISEWVGL